MLPVTVKAPAPDEAEASNNSALDLALVSSTPPVTSTLPFGSKTAVCIQRAAVMFPVAVKVPTPDEGSNNSALDLTSQLSVLRHLSPPVTSTFPLDSSVAVCWARSVVMLPVEIKVPVMPDDGSYSSALDRSTTAPPLTVEPPATSAFPLSSRV